jgi:large subunit ribosomal protein L3
MLGIIGEKIGMTQIYDNEAGFVVPVTVVRVLPNVVTAIRTKEKCGYNAVQLGYGEQKESRISKSVLGTLKKAGIKPVKVLKEFRTDRSVDYKVGTLLTAKTLVAGDKIDVQGTSKGRGFQGVMKRHNFKGGRDSHGNSLSHRVPGSIGQRAYPGRVFPGKKMPGHMGDVTVTLKNLVIVGVEVEQNLILIKGAIPGGNRMRVSIIPHSADFEKRALAGNEGGEAQVVQA